MATFRPYAGRVAGRIMSVDPDFLKVHPRVLVCFGAAWCQPCKVLKPRLAEAGEDLDIPVVEVDVDDDAGFASQFTVMSVPTTIFFVGGKEKARLIGAKSKSAIVKEIRPHI